MSVKIGDTFPSGVFVSKDNDGIKHINIEEYFESSTVVLFALPGAFTPTCSAKHLPGFLNNSEKFVSKGVSKIACMAVNDPHVMKAWAEASDVNNKIDMLSDPDCSISKSLGLDHNFGKVMGHRSKRFAMIVKDRIITKLFVEEIGAFEVSTAENVLDNL